MLVKAGIKHTNFGYRPKAPVVAVNKSGSRIQVVSRKESPPRRTLKSSSARRRDVYGTMRSDEIANETRKRKIYIFPAYN